MSVVSTGVVRLGTRGSALARAQAGDVASQIERTLHRAVELIEVKTAGDRSGRPVAELGDTGVFVTALRDALSGGAVDVAVHSYKDLPTAPYDGLVIAAVPPREDPRDVLVTASGAGFTALPSGARIGTGSPRRAAQLRAGRPDIVIVAIRGNVERRLDLVTRGELDAVVLAGAGLRRLGRAGMISETLDPALVLPAPAQGALAVECRVDDSALAQALTELDDSRSRAAVAAEREVLATLEAGCTAPVGALARIDIGGNQMKVRGLAAAVDGSRVVARDRRGPVTEASSIGRLLAAELIDAGANELLGST